MNVNCLRLVFKRLSNRIYNSRQLIALSGLPTDVPEEITTEKLVEKMYTDKKVRSGQIRFVLMDGIGAMKTFENGSYTKALTDEFLISTINEYRSK